MITRRRILLALAVVVLAAIGWSVWLVVATERDLSAARDAAQSVRASLEGDDASARDAAIDDLRTAAGAAHDRTDGPWWGAMSLVPIVGDDLRGVAALSASLDLLASDAVEPMSGTLDGLDAIVDGDGVDLAAVEGLRAPVTSASAAITRARDLVRAEDSSGFAGAVRTEYDDYVRQVDELASGFASAETALDVLPGMLGADEPRDYLLVFQNNAEIRATAGLPGSWALVHAEDGRLDIRQQGSAGDFLIYDRPIGDLTAEEIGLFGPEMGRFFQDPNFTPDFPRAAEVFDAFWADRFPETPLDGVISLDVVALSYLLEGTGPVTSGPLTLTSDNAVQTLLSDVYTEPDPEVQDEIFAAAARAIFDAATSELASPVDFVDGLRRAATERRLLVAPFTDDEREALTGTRVAGELTGDDGTTPHVFVAINDATASKMSYYLRYRLDVAAASCAGDGSQTLEAQMTFAQTLSPSEAADLPPYVTGGGGTGTDPGDQFVRFHVIGPYGGTIDSVMIDGKREAFETGLVLDGRPATTLGAYIDSLDDVVVTWQMTTPAGQDGDVEVATTPGVVPGSYRSTEPSAC